MKNLPVVLVGICLPLFGHNLSAAEVLSLSYSKGTVKELQQGRSLELENVAVMETGTKSYANFDGKGAIVIPSDSGLNFNNKDKFWCMVEINPQGYGKSVPIITKGSNYRIALQPDGKAIFTYYAHGWQSIVANAPLEQNSWQQLACYFDASKNVAALFVNGKVVAFSDTLPPFQNTGTEPLYIGGLPVPDKEEFRGFIGYIGALKLSSAAPYDFSHPLEIGAKAFEAEPLN